MTKPLVWNAIDDKLLHGKAAASAGGICVPVDTPPDGVPITAILTDCLAAVPEIQAEQPYVPIILVTAESSERLAIEALSRGCRGYARSEQLPHELTEAILRCASPTPDPDTCPDDGLLGGSPAMRSLRAYIRQVAASPSNALITGETGTGKELVAEVIHRGSTRRHRPLVAINCAAIPDSLLESELFGYERGAFTGAVASREGRLKAADGGTVFFDEIGDMSLFAQAKILRAIESRRLQRLGGTREVDVDIRIIAATNRDLDSLTGEDKFRKDLFYRLSVARIELPPLRERLEDLPELTARFIADLNIQFGRRIRGLSGSAMQWLRGHDWPGNIRELRNVLEAAFITLPAGNVQQLELPQSLCRKSSHGETEPDMVRRTLAETRWNKSETARALKWSRMTLYRKMQKYHISASGSSALTGAASGS